MCFRKDRRLRPRPQPVKLYRYCHVSFDGSERTYAYLCDELTIAEGMLVIVPVGRENQEELGLVMKTEYVSGANAPYPVEKTKRVIRQCTAENPYGPIPGPGLVEHFRQLFRE